MWLFRKLSLNSFKYYINIETYLGLVNLSIIFGQFRYAMPTEGAKPSKYDDEIITEELGPNYEQKQWEEEKLGQAKMKFGAKDAKSKNKVCWQP